MKAITIKQPYASLIAAGIKEWETRPAPPNGDMRPDGVRGLPGLRINKGERIAIHAAATWDRAWLGWHEFGSKKRDILRDLGARLFVHKNGSRKCVPKVAGLPLGAVVCTAIISECLPIVEHPSYCRQGACILPESESMLTRSCGDTKPDDLDDQIPFGTWMPGHFAWRLTNVELLDAPVPAKGKQGVWEWEANLPRTWLTTATKQLPDSLDERKQHHDGTQRSRGRSLQVPRRG